MTSRWAAVAGPLAGRPRGPLGIAAVALALVTAAYTAWSVGSVTGWVLAIVLPVLVLRFPVAGMATVAIVAQEIATSGTFGVLTLLGNEIFFSHGKVPVLLLVAATAACAALARSWPLTGLRPRFTDWMLFGSVAGLVLLAAGIGLIQGQSPFSALNQNARSFVLLALGCVLGAALRFLPGERASLRNLAGWALVGLAAAAAVAIPLGESADDRISRYFVYYDSALPAIAAAVFIAMLGAAGSRWGALEIALLVTLPFLVLISFRRSVWLAAALVFLLVLVVTRSRWARLSARTGIAVAATAVIVFGAPGFAADLGERSGVTALLSSGTPAATPPAQPQPTVSMVQPSVPAAATTAPVSAPATHPASAGPRPAPTVDKGQPQADSDRGHVGDLRLGWQYVRDNFWTGVGAVSPQLKGLAADGATRVYVHNEVLQIWLRYGPLGPLLLVLFFLAAGLKALAALRDRDSDVTVRSAAVFVLICPPCMMTAPFLSETSRWPLAIGIAAGMLALTGPLRGRSTGSDREIAVTAPVLRSSADSGAPADATVEFPRPAFPRPDDATVEFPRPRIPYPDPDRTESFYVPRT